METNRQSSYSRAASVCTNSKLFDYMKCAHWESFILI
jgi:hypothetical protein